MSFEYILRPGEADPMQDSHRFFANKACKYYPCHRGIEEMNCLFCFCPLYPFMDCGGDYTLTKSGKKNCSNCIRPHRPEGYDEIIRFLKEHSRDNSS